MKWCPKCECVVDAFNECPVCKNDISNEECVDISYEMYRYNKYFFLHLFRKHLFQTICVLVTISGFILAIVNGKFHKIGLIGVLLAVVSLVESLYENRMISFGQTWYSSDVAEMSIKIGKYIGGVFGVVVAILLNFM